MRMRKLPLLMLVLFMVESVLGAMQRPPIAVQPSVRVQSKNGWADKLNAWQRFRLAVRDATEARLSEVSSRLISINPANELIVWEKDKGMKGKVLVVSYMDIEKIRFYLTHEAFQAVKKGDKKVGDVDIKLNSSALKVLNHEKQKWMEGAADSFPVHNHLLRGGPPDFSWVTVPSEVQGFLYRYKKGAGTYGDMLQATDLQKRMDERLGLYPEHVDTENNPVKDPLPKIFIEQWIDPKDLFRPSADSEIIDADAFPLKFEGTSDFFKGIIPKISVDIFSKEILKEEDRGGAYSLTPERNFWVHLAHKPNKDHSAYATWYKQMMGVQYVGRWAAPWTRLGYTYDYSAEAFNSIKSDRHYGASEFCIKPPATTIIKGIYSIDEYAKSEVFEGLQKEIEDNVVQQLKAAADKIEKNEKLSLSDQLKNITKEDIKGLVLNSTPDNNTRLTVILKELRKFHKGLEELVNGYSHYLRINQSYAGYLKKFHYTKPQNKALYTSCKAQGGSATKTTPGGAL